MREAGKGLPEGWRYPPAMAIGLTDHIWTWEEFLTLSIPKGVTIHASSATLICWNERDCGAVVIIIGASPSKVKLVLG